MFSVFIIIRNEQHLFLEDIKFVKKLLTMC